MKQTQRQKTMSILRPRSGLTLSQSNESTIRFRAKLLRPDMLILPKGASAKLPSRDITMVQGTINGFPFRAMLEPDGKGSHWLKVSKKMREAAGVDAGDTVMLEIQPTGEESEAAVPSELRKALANTPTALSTWTDITPMARRDWIRWIDDAKLSKTRKRRIKNACEMLASGKRRVCCFDKQRAIAEEFERR